MTINLDMVRLHHDRAVQVGRKLNSQPLDHLNLSDLFACCSDIPELVEEVEELRLRLRQVEPVVKAAKAVVTADLVLMTSEYIGEQEKRYQSILDALHSAVDVFTGGSGSND